MTFQFAPDDVKNDYALRIILGLWCPFCGADADAADEHECSIGEFSGLASIVSDVRGS